MSTLIHPISLLTLDKKVDQTSFKGMIDSLLYLIAHRLDIMFNLCLCAWFQVDLNILKYKKSDKYKLKGYNDADFTGDKIERKSTSGGCHFIGAN
ncbi:hypothetical protein CR513_54403, partial [Mucuna pruriens]